MIELQEEFSAMPGPHWRHFLKGQGSLEPAGSTLRLVTKGATASAYTDAQIDDYDGRSRRDFPGVHRWSWRSARASRTRRRNRPTTGSGRHGRLWLLERSLLHGRAARADAASAIWFFYASPPSNMKLDLHTPGYGWKAATIDALRWPACVAPGSALRPADEPSSALSPALARRAAPAAGGEAPVRAPLTEWHDYTIEWGTRSARFSVDGTPLLVTDRSPRGPLGLVIWLDNQYLVATPWGRFRYGLLASAGRQWLELASLSLESGGAI